MAEGGLFSLSPGSGRDRAKRDYLDDDRDTNGYSKKRRLDNFDDQAGLRIYYALRIHRTLIVERDFRFCLPRKKRDVRESFVS